MSITAAKAYKTVFPINSELLVRYDGKFVKGAVKGFDGEFIQIVDADGAWHSVEGREVLERNTTPMRLITANMKPAYRRFF